MGLQTLWHIIKTKREQARQREQRMALAQLGAQFSAHMRSDLGLDNVSIVPPIRRQQAAPQAVETLQTDSARSANRQLSEVSE